jgi:hydroxylamine dehydrogenase
VGRQNVCLFVTFSFLALFFVVFTDSAFSGIKLSKETEGCLKCHKSMNPGLVKPWEDSRHAAAGVGCYECHQANPSDIDAMNHNGHTISIIVSPKDCSKCHAQEVEEMTRSHHAKANQFTGSMDNFFGRIVTGEPNFNLGCAQCHGSQVEVEESGKLTAGPWPNTGIGRVNPDGSLGSCVACHQRHAFSVAQARDPYTCGKCHQGPDHPQIEIFIYSKHGIAWNSFKDKLNIENSKWVLGEDYVLAPTCVTCHMGETVNGVKRTHDVGTRIKWTLRPPISKVLPNGKQNRETMKKVCSVCHQQPWINGFFKQFDSYVNFYNDKFAIPATNIMKFLKENKVIDPTPANEEVEIHYWHLWHHEGRRGRHGAAMNAPDWSHWHGMYEVAINFYFHLLPSADEAVKAKHDEEVTGKWKAFRAKIMDSPMHKWKSGVAQEELEKMINFYKDRYGKEYGM